MNVNAPISLEHGRDADPFGLSFDQLQRADDNRCAGQLALVTDNNIGGTSTRGVLTFTTGQGSVHLTGGAKAGAGLTIDS